MTVKEILSEWLKSNGYDGLWNELGECACDIENLLVCEASPEDCEPGYKEKCDCGDEEHSFHIEKEKKSGNV